MTDEVRHTKAEELQAIQEISEGMLTSDGRGSAQDMLYELRDALHILTDRWDLCLAAYKEIYRKKNFIRWGQSGIKKRCPLFWRPGMVIRIRSVRRLCRGCSGLWISTIRSMTEPD